MLLVLGDDTGSTPTTSTPADEKEEGSPPAAPAEEEPLAGEDLAGDTPDADRDTATPDA